MVTIKHSTVVRLPGSVPSAVSHAPGNIVPEKRPISDLISYKSATKFAAISLVQTALLPGWYLPLLPEEAPENWSLQSLQRTDSATIGILYQSRT